MLMHSVVLGPDDGFHEIEDPSARDVASNLEAVLNGSFDNGFHLQLEDDGGHLALYSAFYDASAFPDLLHLQFVEEEPADELLNSAPTDDKDMLLHGKSYYAEEGVVNWMQVRQCSNEQIIAAFQSFAAGTEEWKTLFDFDYRSRQFPNRTQQYLAYFGLDERSVVSELKQRYRAEAACYHPDKVATLGAKIRELAENEMKFINAAYQHLNEVYSLS